jgi:hypothetical protein
MNRSLRLSRMPSLHALATAAIFLSLAATESHAQWAWAKPLGISGTTVWSAGAIGADGNFYFGGVSDKLTGNPVRGFVMARYSDTLAAKWNTKILGGTGAYAGETCLGVDSAGNSYLMDKFPATPLILPDSTQVPYTMPSYFVSRYQADGKLSWCKKLSAGIQRFQVLPEGTLCIMATNIGKSYLFGNDTIPGAPAGSENYFIEIKPDGSIGRSVAAYDLSPHTLFYAQWTEPGKVFALGLESPMLGVGLYHRGMFDLAAKTYTEDGTPLKVEASPNTFQWVNNGFPNSPTTVMEPKSKHVFALMTSIGSNPRLNGADTLVQQTNAQVRDGYVVELDEQMKVVRKVHLTNPLQLAVRDSQVVVTAIVRATSGFGFVSPDTTIKITLTSYNQDGYVVYVMDRDFKRKTHGLVEGTYQATLTPNIVLIGADGGVYLSLQAGENVLYQGMPIVNKGRYLGTMVSKLGVAPSSSIAPAGKAGSARMWLNADRGELILDRPGAYSYRLTNLQGERMASGSASGRSVCDVSRMPQGMYFLTLREQGAVSSQVVWKLER